MQNDKQVKPRIILKLLIAWTLALGISLTAWFLDRQSLGVELTTYLFSYGFFANALPIFFAFFIVLLVTNRLILSTVFTLGSIFAVYYANTEKMR